MLRAGLVLLLVLFALAPHAMAQDAAESDAVLNARRLFNAGRTAYAAARYRDAMGYFERAYALSPRPELLYNLGLSAERLGQRERAIEFFERYLAELPNAENRIEVQGRLQVLRGGPAAEGGSDVALALIVTGAIVAAAGVVLAIVGHVDYQSVLDSEPGSSFDAYREQWDRAPILLGVGYAALGVGVVLAAIGGGSSVGGGSAHAAIGPGSLVLTGTF